MGWGFGLGVLNWGFQLMKYSVDGVLGIWYWAFWVLFSVGALNDEHIRITLGKNSANHKDIVGLNHKGIS